MSKLVELSTAVQQQVKNEYEYSPVRGAGRQLMDIVGDDEAAAALVLTDFENGLSVKGCEQKIKEWADKNHKGTTGWVPPEIADGIIREYFGLHKTAAKTQREQPKVQRPKKKTLSLTDFL